MFRRKYSLAVNKMKELFNCCLEILENHCVNVNRIATDRHVSISSLMDKQHPGINYQYDVCHLSQCVVKMHTNKAKQKGCNELSTIYGGVLQPFTLFRVSILLSTSSLHSTTMSPLRTSRKVNANSPAWPLDFHIDLYSLPLNLPHV